MKYTGRSLLLLISPCAAMIIILMMIAGCLNGPGKIAIAPDVRSKLKDEPEIIAFRYHFNGIVAAFTGLGGPTSIFDTGSFEHVEVKEEPLIPLQESFLAAIKAELKLDNIRALPEPRHHHPENRWLLDRFPERAYDLIQMQRTFQTGLAFDFDRDFIVFGQDPYSMHVHLITSGNVHYCVNLWARARLIRIQEKKILWQGVCDIAIGGLIRDDFREPIKPVVQEKLDSAINACSKELVTQFLGK